MIVLVLAGWLGGSAARAQPPTAPYYPPGPAYPAMPPGYYPGQPGPPPAGLGYGPTGPCPLCLGSLRPMPHPIPVKRRWRRSTVPGGMGQGYPPGGPPGAMPGCPCPPPPPEQQPCGPIEVPPPPQGPIPFYVGVEYLHWWIQRPNMPPLLTVGSLNDFAFGSTTVPGAIGAPSMRHPAGAVPAGLRP